MADTQHFCLRWNNYQSSITSAFENLRDDEDFVDVTLACDGRSLKAHRVVLSACSPYFRELLKSTPCKHPVIVLQDVAFTDLHALVEFIYHGEVNVHQRSLSSFLKTAEVLRVSGLTQQQAEDSHNLAHIQSLAANNGGGGGVRTPIHPHQSYADKLVEDSMFHQGASPPPHLSHSTPNGATVDQLLRRAAAAAAMRRERQKSTHSEEPNMKMHRPDSNCIPANNNSPDVISHMPQITPTDFSTMKHMNNNNTPPIKDAADRHSSLISSHHSISSSIHNENNHSTGLTSNISHHNNNNNNNNNHGGTNGNGLSGSFTDKDSLTPSPPSSNRLTDDVKSEPMDMVCSSNNNLASDDHSNDSSGEHDPKYMGLGNDGKGSLSSNNDDDIDNSIHSHTAPPGFMMSPAESKMFPPGSFNFALNNLSDSQALAGLNSQFQSNADLAGSPQESEGPTQRGIAAWHQPHFPPDDAQDRNATHRPDQLTPWSPSDQCDAANDADFADQHSTAITILVSPEHFENIDESAFGPPADDVNDDDDEDPFQLEEMQITHQNRRHRRMTTVAASMPGVGGGSAVVRRGPSSSSSSKVCLVCNKTFSRAWSLQRHMTDRHFYVPQHLACDICGRTYRSRNSLISHKSQYHGAGISSKIMGEGSGAALRIGRSRNDIE